METVEEVLQTVGNTVGIRDLTLGDVLRVLIMVLVGWLVIRLLMRMVDRLLDKSKAVAAIKTYIYTAVNIFLWFLLALMLAETLGIKATSIIAMRDHFQPVPVLHHLCHPGQQGDLCPQQPAVLH